MMLLFLNMLLEIANFVWHCYHRNVWRSHVFLVSQLKYNGRFEGGYWLGWSLALPGCMLNHTKCGPLSFFYVHVTEKRTSPNTGLPEC